MKEDDEIPESMDAHVFRTERRRGLRPVLPGPVDWDDLLRKLKSDYTLKQRTVDGIIFDPIEVSGVMLLGIHKPLSADFMSAIDDESQDIGDFQSNDTNSKIRFAFSSVVLFAESDHVFAMTRGSRESPHHTALVKFFNAFMETPAKERWVVEPFMAPDQLDDLAMATGLKSFRTSFTTNRLLDEYKDGTGGPMTFAQEMSDAAGVELKLDLRVSIPRGSFSRRAARGLLDLFRRDQAELTRKGSRAKAQAILPGGLVEELYLVRHQMAFSFELPVLRDEQRNFTKLAEGLLNVRSELDNQVKQN